MLKLITLLKLITPCMIYSICSIYPSGWFQITFTPVPIQYILTGCLKYQVYHMKCILVIYVAGHLTLVGAEFILGNKK